MMCTATKLSKKSDAPMQNEIKMDLCKLSDDINIFRSSFDAGVMFMLSIRHDSLTYMMKQNLEAFAEVSITELEEQWQVMYASNNEQDTDQVGQVAYLKGFYIRADLFDETGMATVENFIAYIDAFVRHRRETDARSRIPTDVKFVITNHTNLDLEFEPELLVHEAEIHAGQEPIQAVLKLQPPCQSRRRIRCRLKVRRFLGTYRKEAQYRW
jgi:hypothetical protein